MRRSEPVSASPGGYHTAAGVVRDEAIDIEAIYDLLERPAWMAEAACHGKSELFFVERAVGVDIAAVNNQARAICAGCPVAFECAAAGQGEQHGIWAGLTTSERREARRRRSAA